MMSSAAAVEARHPARDFSRRAANFLQQLGPGLGLHPKKPRLTVPRTPDEMLVHEGLANLRTAIAAVTGPALRSKPSDSSQGQCGGSDRCLLRRWHPQRPDRSGPRSFDAPTAFRHPRRRHAQPDVPCARIEPPRSHGASKRGARVDVAGSQRGTTDAFERATEAYLVETYERRVLSPTIGVWVGRRF